MSTEKPKVFFCYARADSEFALKLANDLRSAGANIWIDQLDIPQAKIGISTLKKLWRFATVC